MKQWKLPEIPKTWMILFMGLALCYLRSLGIDTFVTAALSGIMFYILGRHIQQTAK